MTDQSFAPNLAESFDRLSLNQLSKSSPSRLPPFQIKRSRSQQVPLPTSNNSQRNNADATSPPTNSKSTSKSSNLSHVPCKFFKQGTCTAGANCIFSHNPDLTSESAVCKYFLKGNCKFGSKCALLHTMSGYTPDTARKPLMNNQRSNGSSSASSQRPSLAHHHSQQQQQQQQQQHMSYTGLASSLGSSGLSSGAANGNGNGGGLSMRSPPPMPSSLDFGSPVRSSYFHDMYSTSPDAQHSHMASFSHLTAAIHHQQQDLYSTSYDHQERQKYSMASSPLDGGFFGSSSLRNVPSPHRSTEFTTSSSPFAQRSMFLHPSSSSSAAPISTTAHTSSQSMLSSSLSRGQSQPLRSIPESSRFLDMYSSYEDNSNNDINDAMLPSSLNDLLTPTELQLRRAREQQHATPLRGIERSPSDSLHQGAYMSPLAQPLDMAHSPFEQSSSSWHRAFRQKSSDGYFDDEPNGITIPSQPKEEIEFKSNRVLHNRIQDSLEPYTSRSNSSHLQHHQADDDEPFYMEDTGPSTATATPDNKTSDRLTSFGFSSLISVPRSS